MNNIKTIIQDHLRNIWNDKWIASKKGTVTKKFFPTIYHSLKSPLTKTNFFLGQILTGHGNFNTYLQD